MWVRRFWARFIWIWDWLARADLAAKLLAGAGVPMSALYQFVHTVWLGLSGWLWPAFVWLLGILWMIIVLMIFEARDWKARSKALLTDPNRIRTLMTARQAIEYLAEESQWGHEKAKESSPEVVVLSAFLEFGQHATQLHAIGKERGMGQHVEIPREYWFSGQLDMVETLRPGGAGQTEPSVFDGPPDYEDVRIDRADVMRVWPKA